VRFSDLMVPKMRKILLVGVVLAVLQQWSGINVLFNYAEEIYRSAGYGVNDIMFNIVITGAINLVFTLLAIGLVDKAGRRVLMLIGCAGIGLSHVLLGAAYVMQLKGLAVLIFTLCSLGCYGMSLAPITWVLISEIFPNRIRGAAISVAVSALWIACFILTYTFPILNGAIGTAKTFWVYAAICFAGFVFVWVKVPETKGKSLEQIERELVD
jgi:MFS family permease